jgi:hypothetical protein
LGMGLAVCQSWNSLSEVPLTSSPLISVSIGVFLYASKGNESGNGLLVMFN